MLSDKAHTYARGIAPRGTDKSCRATANDHVADTTIFPALSKLVIYATAWHSGEDKVGDGYLYT